MLCPALGKVPSVVGDDLVLKLTATGVTFLHERKFKQRYTGSKTCAVDINGGIWLYKEDLKRHQHQELIELGKIKPKKEGKKKLAALPDSQHKLIIAPRGGEVDPVQISSQFSDSTNISPVIEKKSKKERKKSYSINKREVRQRILAYINTQKGSKHLFFWTVTFPAGTPDSTCYQAFNTWLTKLRTPRKVKDGKVIPAMLKDYLWIAERQEGTRITDGRAATNTIHFHIAIPHFMNVQRANAMMRDTLRNLAKKGLCPGAVCGKDGTTYFLPSIAKYNGVDICKHRKTKKVINFAVKKGSRALASYLTKYVTKNDAGVKDENGNEIQPGFDHLAWHNSRGFTCLFTAVTFSIKEFDKFGFRPFLNRLRVFTMNFATFVPWLFGPPPLLLDHLYQLNTYIQTQFDNERQAKI